MKIAFFNKTTSRFLVAHPILERDFCGAKKLNGFMLKK